MANFIPGQFVWHYVEGMDKVEKYIYHGAPNNYQIEVVDMPVGSPEPRRFTLLACACFPNPTEPLEILKGWEAEKIRRLNDQIAEDTEMRDEIIQRRRQRGLDA